MMNCGAPNGFPPPHLMMLLKLLDVYIRMGLSLHIMVFPAHIPASSYLFFLIDLTSVDLFSYNGLTLMRGIKNKYL